MASTAACLHVHGSAIIILNPQLIIYISMPTDKLLHNIRKVKIQHDIRGYVRMAAWANVLLYPMIDEIYLHVEE